MQVIVHRQLDLTTVNVCGWAVTTGLVKSNGRLLPGLCRLTVDPTTVTTCYLCQDRRNVIVSICLLFLPSARQHLSYGDCLEVKREY